LRLGALDGNKLIRDLGRLVESILSIEVGVDEEASEEMRHP